MVQNAWEEFSEETVARAYFGHHQYMNAMMHNNGGNWHMKDKGRLYANIRKCTVPYLLSEESTEPTGVEVIETLAKEDVVDYQSSGLKYQTPDPKHFQSLHGRAS